MREVLAVLWIVALMVMRVEAAGKKPKEIPTQICTRGKLIFGDDFSGQELLWAFDPEKVEWKIAKGALVTKFSGAAGASARVTREIPSVNGLVIQIRMFLTSQCAPNIIAGSPGYPFAGISVKGGATGTFSLLTYSKEEGKKCLAVSPFPFRKPRWVTVLFEIAGPKCALTLDGKTITCESPTADNRPFSPIIIEPYKSDSEAFAVDDVQVWEGLPKDDGGK